MGGTTWCMDNALVHKHTNVTVLNFWYHQGSQSKILTANLTQRVYKWTCKRDKLELRILLCRSLVHIPNVTIKYKTSATSLLPVSFSC
jgi:hypothetical protein